MTGSAASHAITSTQTRRPPADRPRGALASARPRGAPVFGIQPGRSSDVAIPSGGRLPVVDVELLGRLAQGGGQGDEPLRLLARLAADADPSGEVHDFSLSAYARQLGYGPSGRRTLSGYLRALIAAGAVAYVPARGPAPGRCQLRLMPPPETRALIRAPQTRRADFCPSDQHFSPAPKGLKERVKGSPPLTPPSPHRHANTGNGLGGGTETAGRQSRPGAEFLDALTEALPPNIGRQPRQLKDGGGWNCLATLTAELAELIGVEAAVAAITANPPSALRSPVAWLLARARQALTAATTGRTAETDRGAPIQPSPTPRHSADDPIPTPPPAPQPLPRPTVTLVVSAPVAEALAAVAKLTAAGRWRSELTDAARGGPVVANGTIRELSVALAAALAASPRLTPRALVAQLTARALPPAVRDLPSLLAARARAIAIVPARSARTTGPPSTTELPLAEEPGSSGPTPSRQALAAVDALTADPGRAAEVDALDACWRGATFTMRRASSMLARNQRALTWQNLHSDDNPIQTGAPR